MDRAAPSEGGSHRVPLPSPNANAQRKSCTVPTGSGQALVSRLLANKAPAPSDKSAPPRPSHTLWSRVVQLPNQREGPILDEREPGCLATAVGVLAPH